MRGLKNANLVNMIIQIILPKFPIGGEIYRSQFVRNCNEVKQ